MSDTVDIVEAPDTIVPLVEDSGISEDAAAQNEAPVSDEVSFELNELFQELSKVVETSADEPKEEPDFFKPEPKKEPEPANDETESMKELIQSLEKDKSDLSAKLSEYEAMSKKLEDNENVLKDANSLWEDLMNHKVLGPLVNKYLNDEEINLSETVIKQLEDESKVLETTTESNPHSAPSKEPDLWERMKSTKI